MTVRSDELQELEADARYAHERAAEYRAQVWSRTRPASDNRMRQLEEIERSAADRLHRARERKG
jgi:hypothetical protein